MKTMITRIRLVPAIALCGLAASLLEAQPASVGGPTAGMVFDSSAHTLRPVLGVPGASLVGDPIDFGFAMTSAYVAPRLDLAMVVAADGSFHIFRLGSPTVSEKPADGVAAVPDRVIFSPSGSAAALCSAGAVQVLTGLPDAPAPAWTFPLDQAPGSLAISDDGAFVAAVSGGSIRLFGQAGDRRSLMAAGDGAVAAFAPTGHDLAVADSAGAGLMLFHSVDGDAQQSALAPSDDAIASATGLAFSADGRRLFLASSAARGVAVFDVSGATRAAIPCSCAPGQLTAMGNVLRLNELGSEPLWLLDSAGATPRIVFVPQLPAR